MTYRSDPAAVTVLRHLFIENASEAHLDLLEAHGYVLLSKASVRETDERIAHALALLDGLELEGECAVGCPHCRVREALDPAAKGVTSQHPMVPAAQVIEDVRDLLAQVGQTSEYLHQALSEKYGVQS